MMTGIWNLNTKKQKLTTGGSIMTAIGVMEESETDLVDTHVQESGPEEPH